MLTRLQEGVLTKAVTRPTVLPRAVVSSNGTYIVNKTTFRRPLPMTTGNKIELINLMPFQIIVGGGIHHCVGLGVHSYSSESVNKRDKSSKRDLKSFRN